MSDSTVQLVLGISSDERIDDEEVENLTQQLRNQILDTDVSAVEFISSGDASAGSRAFEAVTLEGNGIRLSCKDL